MRRKFQAAKAMQDAFISQLPLLSLLHKREFYFKTFLLELLELEFLLPLEKAEEPPENCKDLDTMEVPELPLLLLLKDELEFKLARLDPDRGLEYP